MSGHPRYLRNGNWGTVPREEVPRTENEEARRVARDWLRDRSDDDAIDFEEMPDLGY
jgi:hypothetical protein